LKLKYLSDLKDAVVLVLVVILGLVVQDEDEHKDETSKFEVPI
jgi:hypothetical protein